MRYRAHLTAGALKVSESRTVADLLLRDLDPKQWNQALVAENVLQTRSPRTAQRLAGLLRGRLETMEPPLWLMVRDGSNHLATHACLAAAVKHSPLLGDYLDLTVRREMQRLHETLDRRQWHRYVEECRSRDPEMPKWSEATIDRLRSSVLQILAQAGYIENTRTLRLQSVHVASEVLDYLRHHRETYVLRCLLVDR